MDLEIRSDCEPGSRCAQCGGPYDHVKVEVTLTPEDGGEPVLVRVPGLRCAACETTYVSDISAYLELPDGGTPDIELEGTDA